MVYDARIPVYNRDSEDSGYAVHSPIEAGDLETDNYWSIFIDDGRGNGDFVAFATDEFWAFKIANALDESE